MGVAALSQFMMWERKAAARSGSRNDGLSRIGVSRSSQEDGGSLVAVHGPTRGGLGDGSATTRPRSDVG